jgi:hypothetical protein
VRLDKRRIYYNTILGALGGLVGWALISLLLRGFNADGILTLYAKDALLGALVGVSMGAALGSVEGVTAARSARKLFQGAGYGGTLGLVAGVIGLIIGELIFSLAGGGVLPRAIGWAIFGMLLGMSDGSPTICPPGVTTVCWAASLAGW